MATDILFLGLSTDNQYVERAGHSQRCTWKLTDMQAALEVEALTPSNKALAETISAMESRGITLLYGRWLIEGAPRVLLIDTKTGYRFLDEWKADLWNTTGIPSPPGDDETNEAVVFGYLLAWFLGEVRKDSRMILQCS
jgi:glycogen(starch) synthase